MIKYLGTRTRMINPAEAKELLGYVSNQTQRRLRPRQVAKLAKMLSDDKFILPASIIIAVMVGDSYENEKRLANGQHTLRAIITSDRPARCHIDRVSCDDEDDYNELFSMIDTEIAVRTNLDVADSFIKTGREGIYDIGLSAGYLNAFRSGLDFSAGFGHVSISSERSVGFNGDWEGSRTKYDRFQELVEYTEQMKFYLWLITKVEDDMRTRLVKQRAMVSAMIATHLCHPKMAANFWEEVVTGMFPSSMTTLQGYPPHRLRNLLITCAIFSSRDPRKVIGRTAMYIGCVKCWNAYAQGKGIGKLVLVTSAGGISKVYNPSEDGD